ncbi:MAG: hypothetical protein P9M14_10775 [Candidatus Alcyoniella australis]|nr:hypothetical protein [Candidatus Alcyoniella australis]
MSSTVRRALIDLRGSWAMLLGCALLALALPTQFDHNQGLRMLGALSMARNIFWFALTLLAVNLMLPGKPRAKLTKLSIVLQIAILAGIPLWLWTAIRNLVLQSNGLVADELARRWIVLNILGMTAISLNVKRNGPLDRVMRVPLLGDLLLPAAAWASSWRRYYPTGALPRQHRLAPLIPVVLFAGMLTLLGMSRAPWRPEAYQLRERILWERECYGLALDSEQRIAMATSQEGRVMLVDTSEGTLTGEVELGIDVDLTGVSYDSSRGLLYAVAADGRAFTVDPRLGEAQLLGTLEDEQVGFVVAGCTDHSSMLLSYGNQGRIDRLDLFGLRIERSSTAAKPNSRDSLFDLLCIESRGLLYALSLQGTLDELKLETLDFERRVGVPGNSAGLAYDPQTDRLLVAAPTQAQVLLIDRKTLEPAGSIQTLVGCRALAVEPEQRLLFVAGFAPYLEIFDLDTLEPLDRVLCPPWVRKIVVDPQSRLALMTDKHIGLTFYRYGPAVRRGRGPLGAFDDPFFPLARAVGLRLLKQ